MSNRRVKSLAYDDDLDDYEEEEEYEPGANELSDGDREKLRTGTGKVREALGPTFSVSDDAIQESLYYYYYDVGKTTIYLKSLLPS